MNRATSYLLLVIGAVLGYIGSYFGQSGLIRTFISLSDYLGKARVVLMPPHSASESETQFNQSVCLTAWGGVIIGVFVVGGFIAFFNSTKKRPVIVFQPSAPKARSEDSNEVK